MCSDYFKFDESKVFIDKYVDFDTKQIHNLLIYEYSINGINHDFIIGSVIGNENEVLNHFKKIIDFRTSNTCELFIFGAINEAYKNNIFENIKLSLESYNLLVKCKSNAEFMEYLQRNYLKEIIIDHITKRMSAISLLNDDVFNHISYYEQLEEEKEQGPKKHQKVI